MTTYKELADRMEAGTLFPVQWNELITLLRSLDAQQPVEIDWPVYHSSAMGCGLEDRDITDRYEAMYYGWCQAIEKMAESLPEPLYAAPVAAVRKAMARLADLLDEDKFMEIEGILTSAGFTPPVAAQPQQASKPLSDAEIAFCIFESKMKNPAITRDGTTSIRIARAAITAFCLKNGIKERG